MSSLSYAEKNGFISKIFNPTDIKYNFVCSPDEIFKEILKGGMPGIVAEDILREQYFNDYVLTYLERDVRNLTQVGDLTRFNKFLVAVAARNGKY